MPSIETEIALRPEPAYRRLVAESDVPAWHVLVRAAVVLIVIAVVLPIMAVRRITFGLVLTTAAAWSAIVVIQAVAGAIVIASAPRRPIAFTRALDLWFAGHAPYSVWLLLLPFLTGIPGATPHDVMGITIVAPLVWTIFIVTAFCRVVLGTTPQGARWRAALHLALVAAAGVPLILWATGGYAALLSYVLRRLSGVT